MEGVLTYSGLTLTQERTQINHRDLSIQIGRASWLHGTKMTRHVLLPTGFNTSLLNLVDMYIKNYFQQEQPNLAYADVKLCVASMHLEGMHTCSLYVYTTIPVKIYEFWLLWATTWQMLAHLWVATANQATNISLHRLFSVFVLFYFKQQHIFSCP